MTQNTPLPAIAVALTTSLLLSTGCFDPIASNPIPEADDESGDSGDSDTDESTTTSEPDPDSDSGGDIPAICGDGIVEDDEECDDGVNDGSYGSCASDCSALGPHCGDGLVNGDEPCDDGDEVDGNGCNVDCVVSGTVLWTVTYDGPEHGVDAAFGMAVDSQDNIVIAGVTDMDMYKATLILKLSSEGELLWESVHPAFNGDKFAYDVTITPNDNIIISGHTPDPLDDENINAFVDCYDTNGNILWSTIHSGLTNELDIAFAVKSDAEGNIYTAIREGQTAIGNGNITFIRKLSPKGDELWTAYPEATDIVDFDVSSTDEIIVAGRQGSPENWTPALYKLTSDGEPIWARSYKELTPGWFVSVSQRQETAALSYKVQGESTSRILRVDTLGDEIWSSPQKQTDTSLIKAVFLNASDQIIATGNWGDDHAFWVRKYDSDNSISWTDSYNGEESVFGFDQGTDITTDSQGESVAVGTIDTDNLMNDILIRKYAP